MASNLVAMASTIGKHKYCVAVCHGQPRVETIAIRLKAIASSLEAIATT